MARPMKCEMQSPSASKMNESLHGQPRERTNQLATPAMQFRLQLLVVR